MIQLQYDIAVLTVDTPFHFNDFVQPVCLPELHSETPIGTMAMVSGYGYLDYHTQEEPDTLQWARKPVISRAECQTRYPNQITDDMLCAAVSNGGVDSCDGDSGGPLVVIDDANTATLIGVVSWEDGCGDESPGVYSKVSHVVDWIKEAMLEPAVEIV